jgi:dienelactone hydrolase
MVRHAGSTSRRDSEERAHERRRARTVKDSRPRRHPRRPGRSRRRRLALAVALLVVGAAALLVFRDGRDPAAHDPRGGASGREAASGSGRVERVRLGRGADGVTVVRPAGVDGSLPGVIFLHGWGQGERTYRAWVDHLARRGNAVIVPRFQTSLRTRPQRILRNAMAGIHTGLAHAPIAPRSLVVAGYSAGGLLAVDYAILAARDPALPDARGLFIVYPGGVIRGFARPVTTLDPGDLPAQTRLTVLVGAGDRIVGEVPATELVAGAPQIPSSRRRLIRVRDPAVDDHRGPQRASSAARLAFWRRLDRLVAASRR